MTRERERRREGGRVLRRERETDRGGEEEEGVGVGWEGGDIGLGERLG